MDLDAVLLSRIRFAFVISFHIIFPAFTIGLAAWLATIEGIRLATGSSIHRRMFDFWLKVFALSFGMGVVTGIVMAFQFGTNWSVLAQKPVSVRSAAWTVSKSFRSSSFRGRAILRRKSPMMAAIDCAMMAIANT
jgi:cytochrome bd ubiquinol oxidase subunit I